MGKERISYLYLKYQQHQLTSAELEEFKILVHYPEFDEEFAYMFEHRWKDLDQQELYTMPLPIAQQQLDYITSQPRQRPSFFKLWHGIAAAMVLLILSIGLFRIQQNKQEAKANVIVPGKNTAVLTLANGKKITLSESKNGVVINAAKLSYSDGTAIAETGETLAGPQTIATPRGGTYLVMLPDGSKVVLNAAATLKYPTSFKGLAERRIELSGEAYFEVAKDQQHPFIVVSKQHEVRVLGTHFNVKAYAEDEEIKTTLLEGSVQINKGTLLKPGQQSVVVNGKVKVLAADVEMETAWKEGYFIFDGQDFKTIIDNISRWYNVEISYDPSLSDLHLGGRISRSRSFAEVLKMLEGTGDVQFKIEGRRVSVMR